MSAIIRLISGRQEPQFVPASSAPPTASALPQPPRVASAIADAPTPKQAQTVGPVAAPSARPDRSARCAAGSRLSAAKNALAACSERAEEQAADEDALRAGCEAVAPSPRVDVGSPLRVGEERAGEGRRRDRGGRRLEFGLAGERVGVALRQRADPTVGRGGAASAERREQRAQPLLLGDHHLEHRGAVGRRDPSQAAVDEARRRGIRGVDLDVTASVGGTTPIRQGGSALTPGVRPQ